MAAARMHMRFRHRFPLAGHFLHWTVSKKGVSLNAHLGPFSKSWGTRGNTSTIDAPGHLGLFWRKQTRRGAHHQVAEQVEDRGSGWLHLGLSLVALEVIVEAFHIWVHPFSHTVISGNPLPVLVLLAGGLVALLIFAHNMRLLGGFLLLPLALIGVYLQWKLFGAFAWHDVHAFVAHTVVVRPHS